MVHLKLCEDQWERIQGTDSAPVARQGVKPWTDLHSVHRARLDTLGDPFLLLPGGLALIWLFIR